MKYSFTVVEAFVDLQDGKHLYRVGDKFPRTGYEVTLSRLNELTSANNALGKPLIKIDGNIQTEKKEEVKKEKHKEDVKPEATLTAESIADMPFFSLKAEAKKRGIDVEDKKAAQLREELIATL